MSSIIWLDVIFELCLLVSVYCDYAYTLVYPITFDLCIQSFKHFLAFTHLS